MDTVQALRKRATDAGFLKDSDLQKVEAKTVSVQEPGQGAVQTEVVKATPVVMTKEVVYIEPVKTDDSGSKLTTPRLSIPRRLQKPSC